MLQGYSRGMHAASFLQWGITQQSQSGGSVIKGTERWSRLLYSPMETMGVLGEHENLVKSPYFLHKPKSSEIHVQHSPLCS